MATVDTYVVNIKPKFDTAAFKSIKTTIESIKDLSIPIKFKLAKDARKELMATVDKLNLKIPIHFKLRPDTQKALVAKAAKFLNIVAPINFKLAPNAIKNLNDRLRASPLTYMVKFSLHGAKADLDRQLAALRFNPVTIPARLVWVGGHPPLPPPGGWGGGAGGGGGGGRPPDTSVGKLWDWIKSAPTKVIGGAADAVGMPTSIGELIAAIGNQTESVLKYDDAVAKTVALKEYQGLDQSRIKNLIEAIVKDTPITLEEAANAMLSLARANVKPETLLGGKAHFSPSDSMLKQVVDTASYADENMYQVTSLFRQLLATYPDVSSASMANKLAGTADASAWTFSMMQGFISAIGSGLLSRHEVPVNQFLALMALASDLSNRASDSGTAMKTFLTFSAIPKSGGAAEVMEKYGLSRYNKEGTKLEQFEVFIEDVNALYAEIEAGGGKTERKVPIINKGIITGYTTETITKETFDDDMYDIFGSDASRYLAMVIREGFFEEMKRLEQEIGAASLETNLGIRSQSPLYKWESLKSSLTQAIGEVLDDAALKGLAKVFDEIAIAMNRLIKYIADAGGLSGIWQKFTESELVVGLTRLMIFMDKVMNFFGVPYMSSQNISHEAYLAAREVKDSGGSSNANPQVPSSMWELYERFNNNKLTTSQADAFSRMLGVPFDIGAAREQYMIQQKADFTRPPLQHKAGDINIYVNGAGNSKAVADNVVTRMYSMGPPPYTDPSRLSQTNGY